MLLPRFFFASSIHRVLAKLIAERTMPCTAILATARPPHHVHCISLPPHLLFHDHEGDLPRLSVANGLKIPQSARSLRSSNPGWHKAYSSGKAACQPGHEFVMIVPLLGPFSGAPSATSFANLSSVGSSATTPPPTTFPENKSISVSGVPGNPDDPTVIEPGTDIFLNQPALTNNPYSCGTNCPDKANDGNDGTYWHDHNLSSNDYWRVALPYSASISSIRFIQGSSEYATTVDIYGSYTPTPGDNPDTHRVLLYDNLSVGPGTQIISIPYGMAFNYYYIQLQTWNDTAWECLHYRWHCR